MKTGTVLWAAAFVVAGIVTPIEGTGGQDATAEAQVAREIGAQLDELGTTLRAAVMSGALDGAEAKEIYVRVARAAKAAYARDFGDGRGKGDSAPSAKGEVIRLTAPKPERIEVLLEGEFRSRDLPLLRDALDLDRDQMMVAEVLLEDYAEAFALAAAPFREALRQYRGAALNAYIVFVLEDADVKLEAAAQNARQADRDEAVARVNEALARIDRDKAPGLAAASDEDRERYAAWKQSMIAATSELDERLAAIRERASRQLADLGRDDRAVTADDLIDMAHELRADRVQLRADVTTSLAMITTDAQRGNGNAAFDNAVARIRIGQLLPRGRFGGETMNLWAALAETNQREAIGTPSNALAYADALLHERAADVAARLDARTEAAIDREIAGLEYRSVRDEIAAANGATIFDVDERRLAVVTAPYANALRREVVAAVAARDALLALLEESAASIAELDPESGIAAVYRAAALRRGFPVETRRRWAERALAKALALDGLDGDATDALLGLDANVAMELERLRGTAIAKRIERDPKLARDFIDAAFDDAKLELEDDVWRDLEHPAFAAVDDRTEGRLRDILGEQFELLPARKPAWGEGKAQGKGKNGRDKTSGGPSGK